MLTEISVALRGRVELVDAANVESLDERRPEVLSKAVARAQPNGMLPIVFTRWLSKKETAQFADVGEALLQ